MTIKKLKEIVDGWIDDLNCGNYPYEAEKLSKGKLNVFVDGMEFILKAVLVCLEGDGK